MSLAFLFPGQGVDILPSLEAWVKESERVNQWIGEAATAMSLDPDSFFKRGGYKLQATEVYQPVLIALSLGITDELQAARSIEPSWVAGHSLGEIAALYCAGVIGGPQAVSIAVRRGRWMGEAVREQPGGMLALVGCSQESMQQALDLGQRYGHLCLAARNAPDEWVLSGEERAIREVAARFASIRLPVSGSFHGQSLEHAARAFRHDLGGFRFLSPQLGFVSSLTARPIDNIEDLPDQLAGQLTRPVLWSDTLKFISASGVSEFITIGPGKILRGLLRKNLGRYISVYGTDSPDALGRTMEAVGHEKTK